MKRESGARERPREARLRAASAHLYQGITPEVWIQAATMSDIVWSRRLLQAEGSATLADRVLDPAHFEFRYGGLEPVEPPPTRRRTTDRLRPSGD
ncbi:MAG: hypothetical protein H0T68_11795 [Gemmatimonadales bacterium]|nr:hypothetical protein [Gemmatimonadales bacterium]